jgi:uncharacterized protein
MQSATEPLSAALDWADIEQALDRQGWAVTPPLLSPAECRALAALYDREDGFRSRVVMARHGFGEGEYRYFAYPLPPLVADLRANLYPPLARIANRWAAMLGSDIVYPSAHQGFLDRCHLGGQTRPTPLLLRYGPGDHNRLHQDLYGPLAFPLQAVFLLSEPGADFTGGELVLTEQRPRQQTRAHVVPLVQGAAAIFAVSARPVDGARGSYRAQMRHGVSTVHEGRRHTLGIIFHDAL